MRKIYLLLMMLCFISIRMQVFAQPASSYGLTAATTPGAYVELNDLSPTVTRLTSVEADTYVSPLITFFNFSYEGNIYSQFSMSSNGFISFGPTPSALTANDLSAANATARPIIAPLWDDLDGNATGGSRALYEISGTAPNRILTVEWRNWEWNYLSSTPVLSFQTKLYESTGVIQFIYRSESGSVNSGGASIGINNATGTGYLNVTNVASFAFSNSTVANSIAVKPASNTVYTFTPPTSPVACAAPTAAPTALTLTAGVTAINGSFTAASPAVSKYLVVRTQGAALNTIPSNYTVYTVGSTLGNGTIVSYAAANTFASTGLAANTNYTYTVFSANETACVGGPLYFTTAISSSATTSSPSAYTWNATSGTADASVASNWTPARTLADVSDTLYFTNGGSSTITNISTSTVAKIGVANNTTIILNANAASQIVTISKILDIAAGSTFDISSTGTVNTLTVNFLAANSATANIAGTLNISGAAVTTFTATNAVTNISGSVTVSNAGVVTSTANLFFNAGSFYNLARAAGTIPIAAIFNAASTINVTGITTSTTFSFPAKPGNVIWNCPSQTAACSWSSTIDTARGNMTIISTGSGSVIGGSSPDMQIAGNFILNGGTFVVSSSSGYLTEVFGSTNLNGGTLSLTSSTTASGCLFKAAGNFTQISGNTITRAGTTAVNSIAFTGTTSQAVSFGGTVTGSVSYILNNPAGVVLATAMPVNASAINTITAGSYTGSAITYNTVSTLQYNGTANQTANSNEYPATGGPSSLSVSKTGGTILTLPFSRTIPGTLTMSSGDIDLGTNNLTLGTSAASTGTLTYSAGNIRVTTGTLTRWYGTSALPTSATSSAAIYPLAFGSSNRAASVYFSSATALTTGGSITIGHSNVTGTSPVTINDGAYTIDKRTNSYWTINPTGLVATGTIGLRLTGGDLIVTSPTPANLRLTQASTIAGVHVAGTGTLPNVSVNRAGLTIADITNTHYLGASNTDLPLVYTAVNTGNWSTPATWDQNVVPGNGDLAVIGNGTNVTLDGANVAAQLIVSAGGTLTASSNSLSLGSTLANNGTVLVSGATINVTGGNAIGISNGAAGIFNISSGTVNLGSTGGSNSTFSMASGSALNVSSTGTLNVNGNLALVSGATLTQSGGNINVDGNAAGVVANSVASGTYIVNLNVLAPANLSLTGGTFTIVDPHVGTTATTAYALYFSYANTGALSFGVNHTFKYGDGISTDAGSNGFVIDPWATSGLLKYGNLILEENTANAATRYLNPISTTYGNVVVGGDLTIKNGAELRQSGTDNRGALVINKNITIESGGKLTAPGLVLFGDALTTSSTAIQLTSTSNAQSLSVNGTGLIQNSAVAANVTGNFVSVTVNNTNTAGVTLNAPVSVSSTLTLTAGKLNTTAANLLTLGSVSGTISAGTVSPNPPTAGWVNGPLKRGVTAFTLAATVQAGVYPVGDANGLKLARVYFPTSAPATAGSIMAEYVPGNPGGTADFPLMDGSTTVDSLNLEGYWKLTPGDNFAIGANYSVELSSPDSVLRGSDPTAARIVKRATNANPWLIEGTHAASTISAQTVTVKRTGLTAFSDFGIAYTSKTLPVTLANLNGVRSAGINKLSWNTLTEANNAGFELQRGTDGVNFSKLVFVASKAINGNSNAGISYNFSDIAPLKGSNYYRLKQVDKDGKSTLTNIVKLTGDRVNAITLNAVYPNPTKNNINVVFAAPAAERLTVIITDLSGKIVAQQNAIAIIGDNYLKLNVGNLANGTYLIKVQCANGCETAVQKFVKN